MELHIGEMNPQGKLDPSLPEIHMGGRCIFMENIFSSQSGIED